MKKHTVKRSSRQVKVTKRLADSKKQEETFKRKPVIQQKNQKETLAQALKRKRESVEQVLYNISSDTQKEYTLEELQDLDGWTLLRLFGEKSNTPDGVQFKCMLSKRTCEKIFVHESAGICEHVMSGHMIEHVQLHRNKAKSNPSFYKRKRYIPVSFQSDPDKRAPVSSPPKVISTSPKQKLHKSPKRKTGTKPPSPDTVTIGNLADVEEDNLLESTDHSKEALLSAICLERTKDRDDESREKRINTRLHRRKVHEEKKEIKQKKREERIYNRFKVLPSVMVEDFVAKEKRASADIRLESSPLQPPNVESSSDEPSDSEISNCDEEPFAMRQSKTKSLLASLPKKKTKLQTTSHSRMKTVPSILRRTRGVNSSCSNDMLSDIKIESYTSLAPGCGEGEAPQREGQDDSEIRQIISDDDEEDDPASSSCRRKSSQPVKNIVNDDEHDSDASSSSDMASDSSVWDSEAEASTPIAKRAPMRPPRKQKLVEVEESTEELRPGLLGFLNDHCYTDKVLPRPPREMVQSEFFRIMSSENRKLAAKNNIKAKEIIRVMTKSQIKRTDEFRLRGPSSKKIEAAADPKIKARALKLIAELRHRKPKEVMVCTERIVNEGESSFIVQDFYSCEICGKRFTAPNSLYGHYRGHAGIKPFRCDVCGKTFTRSHSLSYHAMIHTNTARFECPVCKRRFRHPTHFKEHMYRHTGEEPYHCTECPRRFKTRNTYRRHMLAKHRKKLTPMATVPFNARFVKTQTVIMDPE